MNSKNTLLAFLGLGLALSWPSGSSAATTCKTGYKYTCSYTTTGSYICTCVYSNGVDGDIEGNDLKLNKKPTVSLTVSPVPQTDPPTLPGNDPFLSPAGVLTCGNPGTNDFPSSGVQTVLVPYEIYSQLNPVSSATSLTTDDRIVKDTYEATVKTNFLDDPANYALLVSLCQNTNWKGLDFVPCEARVTASKSQSGSSQSATFTCRLDNRDPIPQNDTLNLFDPAATSNCASLSFDPATGIFAKRPYQCQ